MTAFTHDTLVAVADTREQHVLDLAPLKVIRDTLVTGAYSVRGLENIVSIERKSEDDLLGCIGRDRERFEREIQRLLAYPCRAIVVESTWQKLEVGGWRSRVTPQAALGSCLGWAALGIPIFMVGDHERAGKYVSRLLFLAARRRFREAEGLLKGTKDGS